MKPFTSVRELIEFTTHAAGAFGFCASFVSGSGPARMKRAVIHPASSLSPDPKVETVPEGEAGEMLNGLARRAS